MPANLILNMSQYGSGGFETIINYANSLVNWWMVPVFIFFIFIAIAVTLSRRENRQYPMSAIVAYSLFACFIAVVLFKLMTTVPEYLIYIIGIGIAIAIAWGIWSNR